MKNKIFVAVVIVFFAVVCVASPVRNILMKKGVIPYENVGNVIEVDKVYAEDVSLSNLLNAVEEGKRTVRDTYTNYLPFYLEITRSTKELEHRLNDSLTNRLSAWGDEIFRERMLAALKAARS